MTFANLFGDHFSKKNIVCLLTISSKVKKNKILTDDRSKKYLYRKNNQSNLFAIVIFKKYIYTFALITFFFKDKMNLNRFICFFVSRIFKKDSATDKVLSLYYVI